MSCCSRASPGIGKSRLTAALAERHADEPHTSCAISARRTIRTARCIRSSRSWSAPPSFARDDTTEQSWQSCAALIAPRLADEDEIALLAELLSLPNAAELNLSPQRKREKLLEALLRQLEALGAVRPVLMVFEDAHWIDPTSRELLDLTVERVPGLPVLVVLPSAPSFSTAGPADRRSRCWPSSG